MWNDCSDIFVADVTIINGDYLGRKTPNPNVLIELGYAIKSLDWNRIILLYNEDYGSIEEIPFDINHQRMTKYSLRGETKADIKKRVINNFAATIEILKNQGLLHGGQPFLATVRKDLGKTILEAMKRIFSFYDEKYVQEKDDFDTDFVVITDEHFRLLDTMAGSDAGVIRMQFSS